jgi:hypothetical protein
MPGSEISRNSVSPSAASTVPELEQSKKAVLDALVSVYSRRAYKHAIEAFISWYCSEPRLGYTFPRHCLSILL